MAFKDPNSFLRYLTMGAVASNSVMSEMRNLGFNPIELERGSSSNKIWSTKFKKLRLPDILCTKTGIRIEVKAKSNLEVVMSHSLSECERAWDFGLKNSDIVAFVQCKEDRGNFFPSKSSMFSVADMRSSTESTKLSRLKSASEGSEQHLTWPTIVPKRSGKVLSIDNKKIWLACDADAQRPARKQHYTLGNKHTYVKVGDSIIGESQFIAGTPSKLTLLKLQPKRKFDPITDIYSEEEQMRYGAAKAILYREDLHHKARKILDLQLSKEINPRVKLEIAGSAAALNSKSGKDELLHSLHENEDVAFQMESVFIITEIGSWQPSFSKKHLLETANGFPGKELRQAAVWGLGRAGLCEYDSIIPFLKDKDEEVVLHAITAFDHRTSNKTIEAIVLLLAQADARTSPTYAAVLQAIGTDHVAISIANFLSQASTCQLNNRKWLLAALGSLPESVVLNNIYDKYLLESIEPVMAISSPSNWLSYEESQLKLLSMAKQAI